MKQVLLQRREYQLLHLRGYVRFPYDRCMMLLAGQYQIINPRAYNQLLSITEAIVRRDGSRAMLLARQYGNILHGR